MAIVKFFEVKKATVKGQVAYVKKELITTEVLVVEDSNGTKHTISSDTQSTAVNIGDEINIVDGMLVGD